MDLSSLSDDQLKQLASSYQQQPSAPTSNLSEMSDDELRNLAKTAKPSTGMLGKVDAAALGFSKSTAENVGALGSLANNILKFTTKALPDSIGSNIRESLDYAGSLGQKGVNAVTNYFSPTTDFELQAVRENPKLYGASAAAGAVGTQLAGLAKPMGAATNVIDQGLTKMAPSLASQPMVRGALNQGAQAFGLGAVNNPDDPLMGGLKQVPLGMALGAFGGAIDQKLQRAGDTLEFEKQNAIQAGMNPNSYEAVARQKNQLKAGGIDYAKNVVGKQITDDIQRVVDEVAPVVKDGELPGQTMARLAAERYPAIKASVEADFLPLNQSTAKFTPSNAMEAFKTVTPKSVKLLPDTKLKTNATFKDLWDYRKELDEYIRPLATKAKKGSVIATKQLKELVNVRNGVTKDMEEAASSMGMGEQFSRGIQNYVDNLLPYNVFKTDIKGAQLSQKAMDDMMTKFNKFTQSKMPNIADVRKIASTVGENGQEAFGWAILQKALLDAKDAKGIVNAKTAYTRIRKYYNMGVFRILGGSKLSKAVNGVKAIADGADEMLKLGKTPSVVDDVIKQVPSLLGSLPGRKLLEVIGGSSITNTQRRKMIGDLISGTLIINKSQKENGQEGLF